MKEPSTTVTTIKKQNVQMHFYFGLLAGDHDTFLFSLIFERELISKADGLVREAMLHSPFCISRLHYQDPSRDHVNDRWSVLTQRSQMAEVKPVKLTCTPEQNCSHHASCIMHHANKHRPTLNQQIEIRFFLFRLLTMARIEPRPLVQESRGGNCQSYESVHRLRYSRLIMAIEQIKDQLTAVKRKRQL